MKQFLFYYYCTGPTKLSLRLVGESRENRCGKRFKEFLVTGSNEVLYVHIK